MFAPSSASTGIGERRGRPSFRTEKSNDAIRNLRRHRLIDQNPPDRRRRRGRRDPRRAGTAHPGSSRRRHRGNHRNITRISAIRIRCGVFAKIDGQGGRSTHPLSASRTACSCSIGASAVGFAVVRSRRPASRLRRRVHRTTKNPNAGKQIDQILQNVQGRSESDPETSHKC